MVGLMAVVFAALIWIPCLHLFFAKPASAFHQPQGLSPRAKQLAERHLRLWTDPKLREQELKRMRASNAEWDFMGRTYLVLSFANMALRDPQDQERYLRIIDTIIAETIRLESEHGIYFFLMPYAHYGTYHSSPAHSLFIDSEIALMLAARQHVRPEPRFAPLLGVGFPVRKLTMGVR
jgi:hypothetical protein